MTSNNGFIRKSGSLRISGAFKNATPDVMICGRELGNAETTACANLYEEHDYLVNYRGPARVDRNFLRHVTSKSAAEIGQNHLHGHPAGD